MVDGPTNPLARFATRIGGIDAQTAMERAAVQLEAMRDTLAGAVSSDVSALAGWMALIDAPPPEAVTEEVHRLGTSIASVAGLVGREDAGDAARSLCDTLDAFAMSGEMDVPAVAVHVQAICLLAGSPPTDETRQRLLDGLHKVRERYRAG